MIFLKRFFLGKRQLCLLLCLLLLLTSVPVLAYPENNEPPAAKDEAQPVSSLRAVTKVRIVPASDGIIIGCLEDGAALSVLAEAGAYYQVDCFEMTGYVRKEQVLQDDTGAYRVHCAPDCSETTYLPNNSAAQALNLTAMLRDTACSYLGTPYVTGGTGYRGFDCSGLTQKVYAGIGYNLKRTVAQQLQSGVIIPKEALQCGDLVFFKYTTAVGSLFSHVGIYLGNGQVLHANSNRGVAIDDLNAPYYTQHYLCARRVILSDVSEISTVPSVSATQNFNSSYWRENSRTEPSGNSFSSCGKMKNATLQMRKDLL